MAGWQGSDRATRLPANWRRLRAGVSRMTVRSWLGKGAPSTRDA